MERANYKPTADRRSGRSWARRSWTRPAHGSTSSSMVPGDVRRGREPRRCSARCSSSPWPGSPVDVITVINTAASAGRPADDVISARCCGRWPRPAPASPTSAAMRRKYWRTTATRFCSSDLMKCMAKDAMDSDGVCRQLRRTLAVQDAIRSTQTDSTARDFDAVLDSALARLDEPDDQPEAGLA